MKKLLAIALVAVFVYYAASSGIAYLVAFIGALWVCFAGEDPADLNRGEVIVALTGLGGSGKSYKLTEGILWALRRQSAHAKVRPRHVKHAGGEHHVCASCRPVRVASSFEIGTRRRSHPRTAESAPVACIARRCRLAHVRVFVPDDRVERVRTASDILAMAALVDRDTREPLEEVHLFLDEVQGLVQARDWAKNSAEVLDYFAQLRKACTLLAWASQHELDVDTRLRRRTGSLIGCRLVRVPIFGKVLITMRYRLLLIEDAEEKHHALWHTLQLRRLRVEIADQYETYIKTRYSRDVMAPAPEGEARAPARSA